MRSLRTLCVTLLLPSLTTSHFTINAPVPLGNNANNEGIAPCGGFKYSQSSNVTDFRIGGDAIALSTLHPQANILFRGTLNMSASGNWTNLFPVVAQYGLGTFCEPNIGAPASWAGFVGLIQVIENAVDGMLYQCAAVRFVPGKVSSVPSVCVNGTGVSGSFTSDSSLPVDQSVPSSTSSGVLTGSLSPTSTPTKLSRASALVQTNSITWGWLLFFLLLA